MVAHGVGVAQAKPACKHTIATRKCYQYNTIEQMSVNNAVLEFSAAFCFMSALALPVRLDFRKHRKLTRIFVHFIHLSCRHIQHGGYPLLYTDHKMYPANFYLRRSSDHMLTISFSDSHQVVNFDSPHPGTWFMAAYLPHIDARCTCIIITVMLISPDQS